MFNTTARKLKPFNDTLNTLRLYDVEHTLKGPRARVCACARVRVCVCVCVCVCDYLFIYLLVLLLLIFPNLLYGFLISKMTSFTLSWPFHFYLPSTYNRC